MLRVVALLLGLSLLGACSGKTVEEDTGEGGAPGTDTPSKPKPSPVKQCRDYATTWCNKSFGCYVQVGRLDEGSLQYNVDQCFQVIDTRLPCADVVSTSGSYDKCITQIKGMACSKWDVPQTQFGTVLPPVSCNDALSFGD